jgi:hypothetical protein
VRRALTQSYVIPWLRSVDLAPLSASQLWSKTRSVSDFELDAHLLSRKLSYGGRLPARVVELVAQRLEQVPFVPKFQPTLPPGDVQRSKRLCLAISDLKRVLLPILRLAHCQIKNSAAIYTKFLPKRDMHTTVLILMAVFSIF